MQNIARVCGHVTSLFVVSLFPYFCTPATVNEKQNHVDDYFAVSEIVHNPPYHAYRRYWNFHKKSAQTLQKALEFQIFFYLEKQIWVDIQSAIPELFWENLEFFSTVPCFFGGMDNFWKSTLKHYICKKSYIKTAEFCIIFIWFEDRNAILFFNVLSCSSSF